MWKGARNNKPWDGWMHGSVKERASIPPTKQTRGHTHDFVVQWSRLSHKTRFAFPQFIKTGLRVPGWAFWSQNGVGKEKTQTSSIQLVVIRQLDESPLSVKRAILVNFSLRKSPYNAPFFSTLYFSFWTTKFNSQLTLSTRLKLKIRGRYSNLVPRGPNKCDWIVTSAWKVRLSYFK